MSNGRHSYVAFYPSDWIAGTAGMSATMKLVYFEICCRIWDKAEPIAETELPAILGYVPKWRQALADLLQAGKLKRSTDGHVVNHRALHEAQKALATWQAQSSGGRGGARKRWGGSPDSPPTGSPINSSHGELIQNQNQNQNQNQKEKKYRFVGRMIRLTATDYDSWRKAYSAIPDLDAELRRIDDGFASRDPPPKNWFVATSAMLAAKHQKLLAQSQQPISPEELLRRMEDRQFRGGP